MVKQRRLMTDTLNVSEEDYANLPEVGTPVYSIIKAETLRNNEEMAITVRAYNMNPGTTLSNVRLGAYLPGGTQIGMFMDEDGTWTSSYGYSNNFTLTANEDGVAYKTFIMKLKEGTTGSANLRIKVGSKNVLTEAVTVK